MVASGVLPRVPASASSTWWRVEKHAPDKNAIARGRSTAAQVMLPGNGSGNSGPAGPETALPGLARRVGVCHWRVMDSGMSGNPSDDTSGDVSGDGRWLTYDELAKTRGITKTSAERLVLRNRWRRQRDNQRVVRILVPLDRLSDDMSGDASDGMSGDVSGISAAFETALAAICEAHASEVAALRERAEIAERRTDAADTDRHAAQARADRAEQRADQADTERWAAETRAHEAEQGRDLAHALTDELRDRLDRVRADLDVAHQQAHDAQAAAEAAQIAQAEAEADAAELRQADAARQGRGRLARLRAAWRGGSRAG
jgi:hypothetical protein